MTTDDIKRLRDEYVRANKAGSFSAVDTESYGILLDEVDRLEAGAVLYVSRSRDLDPILESVANLLDEGPVVLSLYVAGEIEAIHAALEKVINKPEGEAVEEFWHEVEDLEAEILGLKDKVADLEANFGSKPGTYQAGQG